MTGVSSAYHSLLGIFRSDSAVGTFTFKRTGGIAYSKNSRSPDSQNLNLSYYVYMTDTEDQHRTSQTRNERFDLLGNSLAVLSGIAPHTRARDLVAWVEAECVSLREREDLAVDLPPNLFPYIRPDDPDWMPRYERYNQPGEYHNGGIWPFVCGFYVAALVAAGRQQLAEKKLLALATLVKPSRVADVEFGFNEWIRAQDGTPQGQDWQTWSAAMYLYAFECVRSKRTPFFEDVRRAALGIAQGDAQ